MGSSDRSDHDDARPRSKRRVPTGVLLVLGVVLGALVAAPVGVYAASELVTVAGPDGTTAQVTPARQLKSAEASTGQFVRSVGFANMPAACTEVHAAPAGSGLVIKTVIIDVYQATAFGPGESVGLYMGSGCAANTLVARHNPGSVGSEVFEFGPGLVVPPGFKLWAIASNSIRAEVYSFGYKAPGVPVPAAPPAPSAPAVPQG